MRCLNIKGINNMRNGICKLKSLGINNMERKNVKIVVATHKKYKMPDDTMYVPLCVGAAINSKCVEWNYARDDIGINISSKNAKYCELTGLYWAWKNLEADYVGLVHYRRHFCLHRKINKSKFEQILTYDDIEKYLDNIKVFIPKKRRYYIETLYSHYAHTHYAEHLDETKKIICDKYPQYLESFEKVIHQTYGYMFNMAIMEKKYFSMYCEWLFDILFELENRIDEEVLTTFQARCYGRVSEIIFNVWLHYQLENGTITKDQIMELPYIHMEKINWFNKGMAFLKAKFLKKQYKKSF